jgi:heme exporter protein B
VTPNGFRQFSILVGQGIRAELADLERLVSPILFAVTLLVVFSFAVGEVEDAIRVKIYLAETFLTAFFALQIGFSRIFDPDRQDRVFDLMLTYPVSHNAWFLSKYAMVLLLGVATLLPTMFFGAFLHQSTKVELFSWTVCLIAFLALAGLAALGVLLSVLTLKANSRQILYPLLYFPLVTPVLLAAVQAADLYLRDGEVNDVVVPWLGLLLAFDTIYFTLSFLLFPELVDES